MPQEVDSTSIDERFAMETSHQLPITGTRANREPQEKTSFHDNGDRTIEKFSDKNLVKIVVQLIEK